tara:strand:- start:61204 stop:62430 length:1227 start_codon:yes stop_codon:yes gene_type:complete
MNFKHLIPIAITFIIFSCKKDTIQNKDTILLTNNNIIEYYKNNGAKKLWGVSPSTKLDVLKVECVDGLNKVVFKSNIDSISFLFKENDTINFSVVLKEKDTALTQIIGIPKVPKNHDPLKAVIHTEDIKRFWKAYEMVQKSPKDAYNIYKNEYLSNGSKGFKDYFRSKIRDTAKFVKHHSERPKFYKSIKTTMLSIDDVKPIMYKSFENMKSLYSKSVFPDIYFVMGRFTSAGTVSKEGLLIGLNQICRTPSSVTDELTLWQKNNFLDYRNLPDVIAHELIHYQQFEMPADTTTLRNVIFEGMADFIGEKISGKRSSDRVAKWAKGKEDNIRKRFIKDMMHNRAYNWIANSDQETEDFPADQGYWVGYEICKAYYEKSSNKDNTITEMLELKDFNEFLQASGWLNKQY